MTLSMDSALSGLRVAQQAMNTVSNNIANASTPGYTRKTMPQEARVISGQTVGAEANALTRTVDKALIADINTQTALTESYTIRQKYFDRIQAFQGSSDGTRSLSVQITALANTFTQLSAAPDSQTLLSQVVTTATQTANSLNNFSNLLTSMRNDTETDITNGIADINQALDTIAKLNAEITGAASSGRTTADLEDQRDTAIKTVAKYIDISTYQENNQLVVITKQGQTLVGTTAHHLFFQKSTVLPTGYYPGGGLNGVTVDSSSGIDITQKSLGGQLGALFDLRDKTLPQYTAQLDEFSQKLAERFQNEGLKLFTDLSGNVPASIPDPGSTMPYVGFSGLIKVNDAVVADPTLIRNGTTGNVVPTGSNEVISRVAQFAFGAYQNQQSQSAANISVGALIPLLGLTTQTVVTGTANLSTYSDFTTVPGLVLPGTFTIQVGAGPVQVINVNPADTSATLVANINATFGAGFAGINGQGQIYLTTPNNSITLANGTIGAVGLAALGFAAGAYPPPNPTFQVQVGNSNPVTISIAPGDTSVQLLAALNAVPGLNAALNGGGQLVLTPTTGGSLKLTDGTGGPLTAMAVTTTNIAQASFRQFHLGPDGTLSTGLLANSTLQEYISSLITSQGEDAQLNQNNQKQEVSYQQALEARNANFSGVNIDQEMSELIRIQAAYTAAAKMLSAAQKLFDDLLNAI